MRRPTSTGKNKSVYPPSEGPRWGMLFGNGYPDSKPDVPARKPGIWAGETAFCKIQEIHVCGLAQKALQNWLLAVLRPALEKIPPIFSWKKTKNSLLIRLSWCYNRCREKLLFVSHMVRGRTVTSAVSNAWHRIFKLSEKPFQRLFPALISISH